MKDYRLLDRWVMNQDDSNLNLAMAEWYMSEGQTAAAYTHYIKAAENFGDNINEKYHCLMMLAWIMYDAGDRWRGVFQYCRFAKTINPSRPESYFLLAKTMKEYLEYNRINEQDEWIQVYENALIGLELIGDKDYQKLIYFDGVLQLKSIYALSLLKLNKLDDLKYFLSITDFDGLPLDYMNLIHYIYGELNLWNPYIGYHKSNDLESFKYPFDNLDLIRHNHSVAMQDMMALVLSKGKPGRYLEIGFIDPIDISNTKLLEELGWIGLSITNDINVVNKFNSIRLQRALCIEPGITKLDPIITKWYGDVDIDYLSLEFDSGTNYATLSNINLDKTKFKFITVKHDGNTDIKKKVKNRLSKQYNLFLEDIPYRNNPDFGYQDWYLAKDLFNEFIHIYEDSLRQINQFGFYTPRKLLIND